MEIDFLHIKYREKISESWTNFKIYLSESLFLRISIICTIQIWIIRYEKFEQYMYMKQFLLDFNHTRTVLINSPIYQSEIYFLIH